MDKVFYQKNLGSDEPLRLTAIVKYCDCNFGYTKIINNIGKEVVTPFHIDLWCDNEREIIKEKIKRFEPCILNIIHF